MTQPPTINYVSYSVPPKNNGMALASLILGICAYPVSCVPYLNFVCWIAAVLAIVFGLMARKQIAISGGTGHGMATAGLILGIIYLALFVIGLILVLAFGFAFFHLARNAAQQRQQQPNSGVAPPSQLFHSSAELAFRSLRAWLASR